MVTLPVVQRPKPTWEHAPVLHHEPLGDRYRALRLQAPKIAISAQPGQFVMLTVARRGEATPALPRPMAVYRRDRGAGTVDVLYGIDGDGTRKLAGFQPGEEILVVGPLGRGFTIDSHIRSVLLLGRGIGTCSLTTVAQDNAARGVDTIAVTSARQEDALIGTETYREFGAKAVYSVTDTDNTSSPDALLATLTEDWDQQPPQLIMVCGSQRLTSLGVELARRWAAELQVSLEAHMACGLGYCHGCASGARSEGEESPLICADGPVFGWRFDEAERVV
ncbi:dihydroorotate oxidase electron transfer subunit [Streptomyces antimycoticus]|uniref:iron-sulfur cluster-binding protein n=1 Tax=Streptomyces antimycoticus TaxID=68175 RepID=UPI001F1D3298|nr:dihydroorotate oxidase electron transfer subunit [Streptomyces antimycoticus]